MWVRARAFVVWVRVNGGGGGGGFPQKKRKIKDLQHKMIVRFIYISIFGGLFASHVSSLVGIRITLVHVSRCPCFLVAVFGYTHRSHFLLFFYRIRIINDYTMHFT